MANTSTNGYSILHLNYVKATVHGSSDAPWLDNLADVAPISATNGKGVDNEFIVPQSFFEPEILLNFRPSASGAIGVEEFEDDMLTVKMESADSKATKVNDDEAQGYAIDIIKSVNDSHVNGINRFKYRRGQWNIAPASDVPGKSPVKIASGLEVSAGGRTRLRYEDIIQLGLELTTQGCPAHGRKLVLCDEHYADILLDRENFADLLIDHATGIIKKIGGFDIYRYSYNPTYTEVGTTNPVLTKDPWNTTTPGMRASIAFFSPMFGKIRGDVKRYFSPAEQDTQTHASLLNYTHYFYYGAVSKHDVSYNVAII